MPSGSEAPDRLWGACMNSKRDGPGGRGWFPTPGSHRSGRARLGHPAPRTMASLRRNAHPRAAVSDDAPLTAGLALRRRLARCPVRLSARQSMIRSAASLRRVPVGRVPRLHRYYQRTPTSRRPSRRTSFSFAWRYHAAALFAPAGVGRSPGRDCCLSRPSVPHLRWRRRDLPGSWATPACMPRSPTPAEPHAPDHLGAAMVPSALVTASASAMFTDFVAQSRSLQGSLCTLRSRGRPRSTQHSVPAGRSTLAGQDSHLLGRIEGFCHVTTCLPPSPSFAWRKTSPSPTWRTAEPRRSMGGNPLERNA